MNSGGAKKTTKKVKPQNPFNLSIAKKKKKSDSILKKFGMTDLALALGLEDPKPKTVKRVKTTPFIYNVDDKRIHRPLLPPVRFKYDNSYMKQFFDLFNRIGTSIQLHSTSEGEEFNAYANQLIEAYDLHYFEIRDKLIESLKNHKQSNTMFE